MAQLRAIAEDAEPATAGAGVDAEGLAYLLRNLADEMEED